MGIGCLPVRHETPNLAFTPGKLIGSDRAPEQFVDRLDRDGVLDLHEHARTYQYLTGFGFVGRPENGADTANAPLIGRVGPERSVASIDLCYKKASPQSAQDEPRSPGLAVKRN
jgi:hypothetical protein